MLKGHGSGGQAITEFALIAPILLLLLFGVIQLGLLMAAQNGLVNGVRDATRKAATYRVNDASISDTTTFTAICTSVSNELTNNVQAQVPGFSSTLFSKTVAYEWLQAPDTSQYFLVAHVTASFKNPLYLPLISIFFDALDGTTDSKLKLSASEQMRVENPSLTQPSGSPSGRTC